MKGRGVVLSLWLIAHATPLTAAPILEPEEIRERRLIRAERPLWRRALAAPNDLVTILTWPLKHALFWAEDVHLDRRIRDVVMFPVDAFRSESDE